MEMQVFTVFLIGMIMELITNWIPIQVIFRPFNPVYSIGWKLSFTLRLMLKERDRLVKSIG